MSFDAYHLAIDIARAVRPLIAEIAQSDPDLARQLRRALTSTPLNLAESRTRFGKDRRHLTRVAAGSHAEVRAALDVAGALGYIEQVPELEANLDRLAAMLWPLIR